jgi:hypothetical protein
MPAAPSDFPVLENVRRRNVRPKGPPVWPYAVGLAVVVAFLVFMFGDTATQVVRSTVIDDEWTREAKSWIAKQERGFKIVKTYPSEKVDGAGMLDEEHRYAKKVVDPNVALVLEANGGQVSIPGLTAELAKAQGYAYVMNYADQLKATRAVRIEYTTEEGFGRENSHDKVFIVTLLPKNRTPRRSVVERTNTSDYFIGK